MKENSDDGNYSYQGPVGIRNRDPRTKLGGPDQKNSRNSGPDQNRKNERLVDPWLGKSTLADDIEKKLKVGKITILSMSHTWVWWVIDMSHSEKTGQSSKDKRRFLFYRSEWKLQLGWEKVKSEFFLFYIKIIYLINMV